jgi:uncharacterized membrane protein YbhN (UPF0104 family)
MTITRRQLLQLLVSLVVGGLCLWFAFSGVASGSEQAGFDGAAFWQLVRGVPWWSHAGYAALVVVMSFVRTERWRWQVRGLTGVMPPLRLSLAINAMAFVAVHLLPFRLGEFVRPRLVARHGIMSAPAGLAATALERVLDGLIAAGIFGVVLALGVGPDLPAPIRLGGLSAVAFFAGGMVFLVVAFLARTTTLRLTERALRLLSPRLATRLITILQSFLDGLRCFRGLGDLVGYLTLSLVFWGLNGAAMWTLLIGMIPDAPLVSAFFVMTFLVVGVMLPAPPGNVGNFHAFVKLALVLTGTAALPAVAFAVLLHAWNTFAVIAWAGLFALIGGLQRATDLKADTPMAPSGSQPA